MDGNNAGINESTSAAFAGPFPTHATLSSEQWADQPMGAKGLDSFPGFPHQGYSNEELVAIQDQLSLLLNTTTAFPLECALGDCAFLFESRDDIAVIVDSLGDQIAQASRTT